MSELHIGDTVIVRPGERLPADGRVVRGASSVDQAPITGESLSVAKDLDDTVFAGTINGDGSLEIETTKAPEDSTLALVVKMVENAQAPLRDRPVARQPHADRRPVPRALRRRRRTC